MVVSDCHLKQGVTVPTPLSVIRLFLSVCVSFRCLLNGASVWLQLPLMRYSHITWPLGSHDRKRRHHRSPVRDCSLWFCASPPAVHIPALQQGVNSQSVTSTEPGEGGEEGGGGSITGNKSSSPPASPSSLSSSSSEG